MHCKNRLAYAALLSLSALVSCGPLAKMEVTRPDVAQQSSADALETLPNVVSEPLIVGVYSFADQTGQRASSSQPYAEISTAVPQGLSSLLVQELHRAGEGKFFRVVEREHIDSVLNERRIVAASLGEQADMQLPPLLLPGVLLTGGAVSYDRKIYQNFRGLSVASATGRQEIVNDRVGIVLRAVSVQTGEVLESVYVSKEVRSQLNGVNGLSIIDLDVFAAEFGTAENEPVSLAVRMAIASAVIEMVKLGVGRGWWKVEASNVAVAQTVKSDKAPL